MEYLYLFDNASIAIWVIEYLKQRPELPLEYVTVVHLPSGWLIRVKFDGSIQDKLEMNFRAVMKEFGYPCVPSSVMSTALVSLAKGQTPTEVMQRYQIAIVVHGKPNREEIEAFQQQVIQGLGACPNSLQ
ncbi:hypothetical protein HRE53_28500 (plasmid) [Acaryochloris sp. 'Moss Beach']|uniref:hypothetical protein n=1 Tax=Acaryochloris sp. 'Moss Beach' TaxID=2740837 RepID=UPI001F422435|nr:hypothetical protein [Acaryochloris sp. 'Moss Beach']UJB72541.1 hypothetical protein HRE53_28500 [Acaryochloris sp. 'Moss Beach']